MRNNKTKKGLSSGSYPWIKDIEQHIARGQKARALKIITNIIEADSPLFTGDPVVQNERRFAWLYRIDLLREWGRISEALAWTCLECELNPQNVTAQALKERLKKALYLGLKPKPSIGGRSHHKLSEGLWTGVAGMREVKIILERDVILQLQEPELYKRYRIDPLNGILFYGPPGCGKTFIAKKLAETVEFEFIEIKPSDLASIYVHGGQEKIGALFAEARDKAPTIIFFDELDALVPRRDGRGVGHHYSAEVNEFLVQLNECGESNILVIGATNLLEKVDPAVRRPGRMDKKVFIGPPDFEARVELLKLYMQDRPQGNIDWIKTAEACAFHTPAELKHIINEAARFALETRRDITEEDILKVISDNPQTLSAEQIERMIQGSST
jgi:SpoVK/Ycf46/Vps4 family AAA+-type ATPase